MDNSQDESKVDRQAADLLGHVGEELRYCGYPEAELARWLVRVVCCLLADHLGFRPPDSFRSVLAATQADGSDVGSRVSELFGQLGSLAQFRTENGGIFVDEVPTAVGTRSMRSLLLECCSVDWAAVSPAVFGSIFLAAVDPAERRRLGAYYTSEQSVLLALEPLFLADLRRELTACRSVSELHSFGHALGAIKIIDPAMGCGNFLVVAYRELRRLELRALIRCRELSVDWHGRHAVGQVHLDQLYGIELDELPAQIAGVALRLAEHQADLAHSAEFGASSRIRAAPQLRIGNALELDWAQLLPPAECSYVVGNPPFRGKKIRTARQQADLTRVFAGWRSAGNLDYAAAWYLRTFEYLRGTTIRSALVATNSICQGEQVELLWPRLLGAGLTINFAHRTFDWPSQAGAAAVHVVIIGFSDAAGATTDKVIYDHPNRVGGLVELISAQSISPYLVDGQVAAVAKRRYPAGPVPTMRYGSMPNDDGRLLLTDAEAAKLRQRDPVAATFLRRLIGSHSYLHGADRWCLWVDESADPTVVGASPELRERAERVRAYRAGSSRPRTRASAAAPLRFAEVRQPTSPYLLVPRHTSQHRRYVPMAFFGPEYVAHDSTLTVEGADEYLFGVLSSDMFTTWLATVGGRIKSDFRLSAEVVYNTFPFPDPATWQRDEVSSAAADVLRIRGRYPAATLAQLYDPGAMPADLIAAHATLDQTVRRLFEPQQALVTELARQQVLLASYAAQAGTASSGGRRLSAGEQQGDQADQHQRQRRWAPPVLPQRGDAMAALPSGPKDTEQQ